MTINYHNADISISVGRSSQFPKEKRPQIALSGRSNVGKSSLINTLLERKSLARVSSSPGKTVTINYYLIDGKIYFVDLPGYGFARRSGETKRSFSALTEDYFLKNPSADALALVIQLIDCRVGPTEDDELMIRFLQDNGIPFTVVLTKTDKLSKSAKEAAVSEWKTKLSLDRDPIPFSSVTKEGKETLWRTIFNVL